MNNLFTLNDKNDLIYRNGVKCGHIYKEVDGYYVCFMDSNGFWESSPLRAIADILDDLNAEWDQQIKEDFS